jgi:tripartite-type tricarboxylate transporter receptor subunit TctC
MPYDPLRDYAPVSLIDDSVMMLVVHPSLPVKSVREFITLAKTRPGQIGYGSAGAGSVQHLVAHMFAKDSGVELIHVPYKGSAPAFVDLVAGQIQIIFSGVISATPFIKSGKLRGLAVTAAKRTAPYENLPTMKESGGPDIHASVWNGILVPAKTPPAIVERLNAEIVKVLRSPDYIERIRASGGTPVSSTPDEFARFIRSEAARYGKAAQESGARAD